MFFDLKYLFKYCKKCYEMCIYSVLFSSEWVKRQMRKIVVSVIVIMMVIVLLSEVGGSE